MYRKEVFTHEQKARQTSQQRVLQDQISQSLPWRYQALSYRQPWEGLSNFRQAVSALPLSARKWTGTPQGQAARPKFLTILKSQITNE